MTLPNLAIPTNAIVSEIIDRRVQVISGPEAQSNKIMHISGLRTEDFYVLLGEPGMGKSTSLAAEAAAEGGTFRSVREVVDDEIDKVDILYLDGLDEYRVDGSASDKVRTLARAIKNSGAKRWRLTCRAEDWRKEADIAAVQKTTNGAPIKVVQLLPLDYSEAGRILSAFGEFGPDSFLEKAYAIGAQAFTENPMSLKLLWKAIKSGGKWPTSRFDVFDQATKALSFERNDEHKFSRARAGSELILNATGRICLRLLVTGAEYVWRSADEPPNQTGNRLNFLNNDDLAIEAHLLDDVLSSPLFRGEGEEFTPAHRTVAEFLAARELAQLVTRGGGNAIPMSRALALIAPNDGVAPTELRGLFGWFAAHLAVLGQDRFVSRLVEADPMTVLAYGDAAVLGTAARRLILTTIATDDPFFRGSDIGVTAFGGLAGEDIAEDFADILRSNGERSHRKYTVFDAITTGPAVLSLTPLLHSIVVDASQSSWVRERALDALLNGQPNPQAIRRDLLDELTSEVPSNSRESLRVALAAKLWPDNLAVDELKEILGAFERGPRDNVVGRLSELQKSFCGSPNIIFFESSVSTWRVASSTNHHHQFELDGFIAAGLTAIIRNYPYLDADVLLKIVRNSRRYRWDSINTETRQAIQDWLRVRAQNPLDLYLAVLRSQDIDAHPWIAPNEYIAITQTDPTETVLPMLFDLIKSAIDPAECDGLLGPTVELASRPNAPSDIYWKVYKYLEDHDQIGLMGPLIYTEIPEHVRYDQSDKIRRLTQEAEERRNNIEILQPRLGALASGQDQNNLNWFAEQYFGEAGDDALVGIAKAATQTSPEIVAAALAGCVRLAERVPIEITPTSLGEFEARSSRYYTEFPVLVGLDILLEENRVPSNDNMSNTLALIVLKSGGMIRVPERRKRLEAWAIQKLSSNLMDGVQALSTFWFATIRAGYSQLKGIETLKESADAKALLVPTLRDLLDRFGGMSGDALRSAVFAALELFTREEIADFASKALCDVAVTGEARQIWTLVAFLVEPMQWEADFVREYGASPGRPSLGDYFSSELRTRIPAANDVARAVRDAAFVRALAIYVQPDDDDGYRSEVSRVRNAIDGLGENISDQAGAFLREFAASGAYSNWHPYLRHALARRRRLERDQQFVHPTPNQVNAALSNGPPVNAADLMAIVVEDLEQLKLELRHGPNASWKRFWNVDGSDPTEPLVENQGRDYVLDRLQDRLRPFGIRDVVPEARRANETRSDVLVLSGTGTNLPIEVKRHFHPDVWTAAATQLHGYALAPGAGGLGVFLVFWYGNWANPPSRPGGGLLPTSAEQMQSMLIESLPPPLRDTVQVVVLDVSDPTSTRTAARLKRKKRDTATTTPRSRKPEA